MKARIPTENQRNDRQEQMGEKADSVPYLLDQHANHDTSRVTGIRNPEVARFEQLASMLRSEYSGKRSFSLDALRGVAIILVMFRHLPTMESNTSGWLESFTRWMTGIGWIGVDLFFVLSGFLISGLIYSEFERHNRFDALAFLMRRGFKIWPSYLAAYGGMTLARIHAESWKGNPDVAMKLVKDGLCNAIFLQTYLPCEKWSHSWSLAVEEHFYTAFALIAFWMARNGA